MNGIFNYFFFISSIIIIVFYYYNYFTIIWYSNTSCWVNINLKSTIYIRILYSIITYDKIIPFWIAIFLKMTDNIHMTFLVFNIYIYHNMFCCLIYYYNIYIYISTFNYYIYIYTFLHSWFKSLTLHSLHSFPLQNS